MNTCRIPPRGSTHSAVRVMPVADSCGNGFKCGSALVKGSFGKPGRCGRRTVGRATGVDGGGKRNAAGNAGRSANGSRSGSASESPGAIQGTESSGKRRLIAESPGNKNKCSSRKNQSPDTQPFQYASGST